ncbi:hypothetical protein [Roseivirga pacifica]|uniref:hypothetical protein n=1 Tax=Roseivirga pacifica TaxID=1267423 RepID=UPI003BAC1B3F
MEERSTLVEEQPAYKLAVPLFLLTCLPYFGTIVYDVTRCCGKIDNTFVYFGGFYLILGALYLVIRYFKK